MKKRSNPKLPSLNTAHRSVTKQPFTPWQAGKNYPALIGHERFLDPPIKREISEHL